MSKEENEIIGKKIYALRSTRTHSVLHNIIVDLFRNSSPSKLPYIRDSIARVLQGSYNKESAMYKGNPKALAETDQKYNALRVLVGSLSAPRRYAPSTQLASLKSKSKWGSPLVLGTAFLTTLGGAFYLYTKNKKKGSNPSTSPTSGFQKTLKAIQKYKLISQLDFDSNFLEDYESIMKGKNKKIAKKKPYSKADAWTREEGALMKEIDSSFKSITTTKSSGYKVPQLPASKEFDPFSILGNTKTKSKREPKRPKETPEEPEPIIEDTIIEEIPKKTRKRRSATTTSTSRTSVERLVPIVKRTKRISKIRT